MGRELKRVPLDFDYPLKKVWYGYYLNKIPTCLSTDKVDRCNQCKTMAEIKGIPFLSCGCPDFDAYFAEIKDKLDVLCEVPTGDGYQLWETTTEGSPISPVFETLDELCEWCEDNATTFASFKVTKEEWKEMLTNDFVHHKSDGILWI